jgi:pyruvate/2-oxoglutarate dehydrogenase complex dihydrolipoamide acyltransferase (E2) component
MVPTMPTETIEIPPPEEAFTVTAEDTAYVEAQKPRIATAMKARRLLAERDVVLDFPDATLSALEMIKAAVRLARWHAYDAPATAAGVPQLKFCQPGA